MSDAIGYGELIEKSMLKVVKDILKRVQTEGLPGEHHFYITFLTHHPDIVLPDSLLVKFPYEMTIVIQNQFLNLNVEEDKFTIELSFNNKMEKMIIPFSALLSFNDPSVQFALHFNMADDTTEEEETLKEITDDTASIYINEEEKIISLADFKSNKSKSIKKEDIND